MFGSRDVDSYLMPREKAAVDEWTEKEEQFHIMRDGPFHTSTILAGLWGGNNYLDMEKAVEIRKRLLDVPARQWNIISIIKSYYDESPTMGPREIGRLR